MGVTVGVGVAVGVGVGVSVGVGVIVAVGVSVALGVGWQNAGRAKPRLARMHETEIHREIVLSLVNASPRDWRNHVHEMQWQRNAC